jgi:hypothetical protein
MGLSRRQFTKEFKLAAVRRLEAEVSPHSLQDRGFLGLSFFSTDGALLPRRRLIIGRISPM